MIYCFLPKGAGEGDVTSEYVNFVPGMGASWWVLLALYYFM